MDQLAIQVVGGVLVAIIVAWLGIGSVKVVIRHTGSGGATKTWKKIIIVAWLMIVGGLMMVGANVPPPGGNIFNNVWASLGIMCAFFGLVLLGIGKIGHWYVRG